MAALRSLLTQSSRPAREIDEPDLVLGLPLESNGRTIYPVFLDPTHSGDDARQPRQIGFLDVGEERSEFTSLETDIRPLALLPVLLLILGAVIWFLLKRAGSGR